MCYFTSLGGLCNTCWGIPDAVFDRRLPDRLDGGMQEDETVDEITHNDCWDEEDQPRMTQLDRCGNDPPHVANDKRREHKREMDCGDDHQSNSHRGAEDVDRPLDHEYDVGRIETTNLPSYLVSNDALEGAPQPTKVLFVPVPVIGGVLKERACLWSVHDPSEITPLCLEHPEGVIDDIRSLLDQYLIQQLGPVERVAAGNAVHHAEEALNPSDDELIVPVGKGAFCEPDVPALSVRPHGDVLSHHDRNVSRHQLEAATNEVGFDHDVIVKNRNRLVATAELEMIIGLEQCTGFPDVLGQLEDDRSGFTRNLGRVIEWCRA